MKKLNKRADTFSNQTFYFRLTIAVVINQSRYQER